MMDQQAAQTLSFDFDRELFSWIKKTGKPEFNLYHFPFKAVIAGRGSRLNTEIVLSRCRADNIPIYRRSGGGCAVFLDPGNLVVSLVMPAKGRPRIRKLFDQCNQWLISGLTQSGIKGIYQDGISDLVRENRKIGGTSLYCNRDITYYSASILVNPDLKNIMRYIHHPPREPGYRQGRSHLDFVTSLNSYARGLTADSLAQELEPYLQFT